MYLKICIDKRQNSAKLLKFPGLISFFSRKLTCFLAWIIRVWPLIKSGNKWQAYGTWITLGNMLTISSRKCWVFFTFSNFVKKESHLVIVNVNKQGRVNIFTFHQCRSILTWLKLLACLYSFNQGIESLILT